MNHVPRPIWIYSSGANIKQKGQNIKQERYTHENSSAGL